ncbi:hypothetical protein GJAV_G00036340 [Gymnothorax javanicus]|nr:hypothetical protein GJAV_G00036340 [Gymnothorax javanicus]
MGDLRRFKKQGSTKGRILAVVLPPLLMLECMLGMVGNGGALWVFCFYMKPWTSSTVFLFNLALADFLLNVALPFRAIYYLKGLDWVFGDAFCRTVLFMLAMNRSGSIFFLTAVAVDRYLRVVHPHHPINSAPVYSTVVASVIVWVVTIALTVHLLFSPQNFLAAGTNHCDSFIVCPLSAASPTWHRAVFLFCFYLPLAVIIYCSLQVVLKLKDRQVDKNGRAQRALNIIILVAAMFAVCFFPSNLTQLLIWAMNSKDCADFESVDRAFFLSVILTYLNSMLDPVVYYFSSPAFKKVFKKVALFTLRKSEKASQDEKEDQTKDSEL